jgi:hypothetical protein
LASKIGLILESASGSGLDVDHIVSFDDRSDTSIDELTAVIVDNPGFGAIDRF